MSITFVLDATHNNISAIPKGVMAALYTTGTSDIKATSIDFANHPDAIRICQDGGSDDTADILDMEMSAATTQDVANWLPKARASFNSVKRPGQRWPGVYLSRSRVTEQANVFVAHNLTNVPLWIAQWGDPETMAIAELVNANGPWPVVGLQIRNQIVDDFSVFSTEYLNHRSSVVITHPLNQVGTVLSETTNLYAKVNTTDGGFTWKYAGK